MTDDWTRWWRCPWCFTPNPANREVCLHCVEFVPREQVPRIATDTGERDVVSTAAGDQDA